jgi:hypothetical protein
MNLMSLGVYIFAWFPLSHVWHLHPNIYHPATSYWNPADEVSSGQKKKEYVPEMYVSLAIPKKKKEYVPEMYVSLAIPFF